MPAKERYRLQRRRQAGFRTVVLSRRPEQPGRARINYHARLDVQVNEGQRNIAARNVWSAFPTGSSGVIGT
jgi:hypothetical protein